MKPLPSQWTYDRFLNKLDNGEPKEIMAQQVKKLYELGIVDASLITGVFAKNSAAPSASQNAVCPCNHKKLEQRQQRR